MMTGTFPQEAAGTGRRLVLWAAEAELAAAVRAALSGACSLELADTLPEGAGPDEALVLLCPSPAEALCRELEAGRDAAAALDAWTGQARRILALQRRCRSRVRIVDAGVLRREPAAFLGLLGLSAEAAAGQRLCAAAGAAPAPVLLELARSRLLADTGLRRLAGEFAAALALSAGTGAEAAGAALDAYLEDRETLQEADLLRSQQRSMYEQMEMLYGEKLQLEQRLDQMRSGLDGYQAMESRLEGFKARLAAKEAALKEAGAVIAGLEQASARHAGEAAALKRETEALRQEAGALRDGIRRFETSRSYRLTAPLRRLRGALRGRR